MGLTLADRVSTSARLRRVSAVPAAVRGTRALAGTAIVASVGYVVVAALVARHVTFYWDDYFLLLTLDDRGLGGALTTGINGNWWPLATVLLWLQLAVFGGAYPAYLVTNAVLVVVAAWFAWFALTPLARRRPWLVAAALAAFACSLGVVVNVTVMTASWPLALALAMGSAALAVRGRPVWAWGSLLALSGLAESGLFAVLATTVGFLLLAARAAGRSGGRPARRDLVLAGSLTAVGAVGTAVGYAIATREPIDYYLVSDSSDLSLNVVDVLREVGSVVPAWLASPLVPPMLVRPGALPWLSVLVADHLLLAALGALGLAAAVALLWRRRRTDPGAGDRWRTLVAAGLLVVPLVETAVILGVVRPGSGLEPRYTILWLLPAAAAWAVLLQPRPPAAWLRLLGGLATALLVLSALWCALCLPWTFRSAFDIDKQRWDASANQVAQIERCRAGLDATADPQVSPGLRDALLCQAVRFLDSR